MDAPLMDESPSVGQKATKKWRVLNWMLILLTILITAALVTIVVVLFWGEKYMHTSTLSCFYSLGGGYSTSSLIQPKIASHKCERALQKYVKKKGQYWKDTKEALHSVRTSLIDNPKFSSIEYTNMVIFDIDETTLSNLDEIKAEGFGHFDSNRWRKYLIHGTPPAIPGADKLFQDLRLKGYSVAFITGRDESARSGTEKALDAAGFGKKCTASPPAPSDPCYETLIMRAEGSHEDATDYKAAERKRLQEAGFDIVASIGDQWSDLLGNPRPEGIFKMPNPFYYLP